MGQGITQWRAESYDDSYKKAFVRSWGCLVWCHPMNATKNQKITSWLSTDIQTNDTINRLNVDNNFPGSKEQTGLKPP